jgi:hypothetical protein
MITTPGTTESEPNSGYSRLERQIEWYDQKSSTAQLYYKLVKFTEIACAAFIPFVAGIYPSITALLGVTVLLLESLQHINQWSQNWITYRSTCEALRHEKYSYLGRTGVYEAKTDEDAKRILVERIESLISTEHSKWISRQEYETKRMAREKLDN